jgi:hypothetical protein
VAQEETANFCVELKPNGILDFFYLSLTPLEIKVDGITWKTKKKV